MQNTVDFERLAQQQAAVIEGYELRMESLITDAVLAADNAGWAPINSQDFDDLGVPLSRLKEITKQNKTVVAAGSIIGRAVRVRTAIVWSQGLQLEAVNEGNKASIEKVIKRSKALSRVGQLTLENSATISGNVWLLVTGTGSRGSIKTLPIEQVHGYQMAEDPLDGVHYFIRRYQDNAGNERRVAYPTYEQFISGKPRASSISVGTNEEVIPVDTNSYVVHVKFNPVDGWVYSIPETHDANFWSHAYKQAMENDAALKKSLAKFAWKLSSPNKKAVITGGSQVARTNGVGGVVGGTDGNYLTPINKSGTSISFNENWPLAAVVAAAFDIPLDELLYQSGSASTRELTETQINVLSMRQDVWCVAFEQAFELMRMPVNAVLPVIFSEPIHRVAQAVSTLLNTNTLHPSEGREAAVLQLKRYGVQNFLPSVPEPGEWAEFTKGASENPGTTPMVTPDHTDTADKRAPGGAVADGDNELRDGNL